MENGWGRGEEGGREGVEGGRHKLRINFTFFCSHSYALFFGFQYMYMYFCFLFHSQQFFLPVTFLSLVNACAGKKRCVYWPKMQFTKEMTFVTFGRNRNLQRKRSGSEANRGGRRTPCPPWRIQGGATPPSEISREKKFRI